MYSGQQLSQGPPAPHQGTTGTASSLPLTWRRGCREPAVSVPSRLLPLALSPPSEVESEASVHRRRLFHTKPPCAGLCRGTDGPLDGPELRMVPTHQWGVGVGGSTQGL